MNNPMILVKLSDHGIFKNRLSDTPAHVRVVCHEPVGKPAAGIEHWLVNPNSDIRWFVKAGVRFSEALAELFLVKPMPVYKYDKLDANELDHVSDIDAPVDVFKLKFRYPQEVPVPEIRRYDLGKYVYEGVEHDVVGFFTSGVDMALAVREGVQKRRMTVVYMLNTAAGLVEEEFLDHLHVNLTAHGLTTLYEKKACKSFTETFVDGDDVAENWIFQSKAGPLQKVHVRLLARDPNLRRQTMLIMSADKKGELFSFEEDALRHALNTHHEYKYDTELSPDFKWVE